MKNSILFIVFFFLSCKDVKTGTTHIVLENNIINTAYLKQIEKPEKALLSWYLYAYGNACGQTNDKAKCKILNAMHITDECQTEHINMMLQWFSNDMMAGYKLNKCPNLASDAAIQNEFERIIIKRNKDTLTIDFTVKGLNNSQEKSWNVTKVEKYLITSSNFVKLK